ncbi:MAG: hypothetical protein KDB79_00365 [Acidobacteria bacterium]|nr:hypothetical protein [Acidobacteriota bacterium]
MNINTWNSRALSLCLMVAVFATYSVNALAAPPKMAGEIIVSGKSLGDTTSVKVNGSSVESGSSIFSNSTIITPENADAVINVGKIGRVQLSPNTGFNLSFDEKSFTGEFSKGKVVILSASKTEGIDTVFTINNVGKIRLAPSTSVALTLNENGLVADLLAGTITSISTTGKMVVNTPGGKSVNLNTGEKVSTSQDDDDDNKGGSAWLLWALVFGGAAAAIIFAANTDNNRLALGGGGTVISPSQ